MSGQVGGLADADEPRGEAGIAEVELGGLDETLGEVGEPGLDPEDEMTGFEDGEPGFRRHAGDACVGGEGCDIEELADAAGGQGHEALERGEVVNPEDLADITFDIGGDVILEPVGCGDGAIMDWGEEAALEEGIRRGWRPAGGGEFGEGEGQQGEEAGPAGEGLGDGLDEIELAGAGEEEAAGAWVVIDGALEVGEEGWAALDFVEDGLGAEVAEEAAWIVGGEGAGIGVFEGEVGGVGGGETGEGGFAGLTRACDDGDGIGGESRLEEGREEARDGARWGRWRHGDQTNITVCIQSKRSLSEA
jgi:hypothetical protein